MIQPPVRLRLALTARQATALLVLSASAFATLFYLALTKLEWPWFSVWVALLVLTALWAGGTTSARRFFSRGAGWVVVLVGVLLFNIHLYWIQLHRQRSERFDVTGVFVEARDKGMTIGVGEPDLDVRLAGSLLDLDRWSMRILPDRGSFRVASMRGVDWVAQNRAHVSPTRAAVLSRLGVNIHWTALWGLELGPEQPLALVRDLTGASHALRLVPEGRRGVLLWDGRRIPLERSGRALDRRLAQRLRSGIPLSELPWEGAIDPAARGVVVSLVNGRWQWPFVSTGWPRYRVAARDSSLAVVASSGAAAPALPTFTPDDTVRVASGGKLWEFSLRMAPAERWRSSTTMQVVFVRRPDGHGWPFPASNDCGVQRACALVSSHRLPPPIVHFDLSSFGLDTSRYALLGRLDRPENGETGFRFVSDTAVDTLLADVPTAVEARRLDDSVARAGWMLRVHQPESGDWKGVIWTLAALTLFMLAVAWTIRASPHAGRWLRTDGPHARAAWMVANLLTVFMGVRLLLGLRVTYAAPYYSRGAGTAAGLWVTVGVLTVFFGWWPHLWWSIRKLFGRWLGGKGNGSLARAESIPYHVNVKRALLPFVATLALLAVTVLSVQEVLASAFVVGLVLLSWMAVALTELAAAQEQLGHEPFALLTAETRADRAPWIPVAVTATLGFAIAVTSVAPHVMMPLAVLVALVAGVKLVIERLKGRSGAGLTTVLAVTALVALLGALELVGKLQGPALLLGVVFMLFLLGVRAGVLCQKRLGEEAYAARLSDQAGQIAGVSKRSLLLALSLPFVALGLAAVFDFGLGLLMFLPIFLTVLLAAGWNRIGPRLLSVAVGVLVLFLGLTVPVLFPSTERLARETRIDRRAQLFDRLGGPMAWFADASDRSRTAVRRAMIRSLAARDPALLEQLLPAVGPSEARDEIIPSIEQAWGGKAYSAAGWLGAGFAGTSVLGRGISSATSYAENTFAVYVLSEHGAIGGLTVLGLYAALAGVLVWWAVHLSRLKSNVPRRAATLAVVVGGGLLLVLPAAYVALSNLGVVPLTGQNMPFLGLNAWSDVVFVSGIGSAMLMALTWLTETEERA